MFQLHPQLATDTTVVHETSNLLLLLANDARYPWLILVPKTNGIRELYELSNSAQLEFNQVSAQLSSEMMGLFKGDKMNVAALGNQVPQLHVHHVVRLTSDFAWPAPIWGVGEAMPYSGKELSARLNAIRSSLSFCSKSPSG